MNPTSSQLVAAIADVLRTRIAPLLADQPWPASELRSIDALLVHLAARIEHEPDALRADDADLDTVLASLAAAGIDVPVPDATGGGDGNASTGALHASNLARRAALEAAIHLIHDGAHAAQVDLVRSYLRRAAERDRLVYGSFGSGVLF